MTKTNDSSEKVERMRALFDEQRNRWRRKVIKLTKWMKIPEKLTSLEMIIRNEIMQISEEKAKLLEAMIAISKIIKKKKAETLINLKTNDDLKLKNQTEQNILLENQLCDYVERQELIEMQLDFLTITSNNLTQLPWAIKNYIELFKQGIE